MALLNPQRRKKTRTKEPEPTKQSSDRTESKGRLHCNVTKNVLRGQWESIVRRRMRASFIELISAVGFVKRGKHLERLQRIAHSLQTCKRDVPFFKHSRLALFESIDYIRT